jgi:hypothetical protein
MLYILHFVFFYFYISPDRSTFLLLYNIIIVMCAMPFVFTVCIFKFWNKLAYISISLTDLKQDWIIIIIIGFIAVHN